MNIEVKNFKKKFKKNQVGPITCSFKEGRMTALLGVSGSGKSVLINAIVGATKSFGGDITIGSYSRRKYNNFKVNKSIGFYSQIDFSLFEITAIEFLKNYALISGISKVDSKKCIEYWLKYFELYNYREKRIKDFSWGMKNRVNLILCFIKNPQILIMDEPGANLDSYWRNKLKNILIKYKKEGKTILMTSHNIDEISEIIDDYVIIEEGKKVFEGSKEQLNIYSKYKVFTQEKIDESDWREFLNLRKIKSFKYDASENSIVVAIDDFRQLNYIYIFLIKKSIPLKNIVKLPINMESIHKALEPKMN